MLLCLIIVPTVTLRDNPDSNYNKGNAINAGVFYRKYKRLIKDIYFFGEVDGYTHIQKIARQIQTIYIPLRK